MAGRCPPYVRAAPDPHGCALEFARSAFQHACLLCDWDETLAASAEGTPWPRPACLGYPIARLRCNLARNSFGIGLGAAIRSRSHRPELVAVERLQGNVDRRHAPPPGTLLR
jgi:hypothetical protein